MRIRNRLICLTSLWVALFFTGIVPSVLGQGGTGKMPPMRSPPPPPSVHRAPLPMPKSPPARKVPAPERRQVITDVYVVPATASGSLSITDRLPEVLGEFRRSKLETNVADYTNSDHGAVEVLRAEYGKDILIFVSRFQDAAGANGTMQTFAKKVASSYNTISRKRIKNRSGQTLGEFWLLKISGREKNAYLLATNASYLYRVYGLSSADVERVFKWLPLQ